MNTQNKQAEKKEDNHHMFKYVEVKDRLIDIFGKPKTQDENEKFSKLCGDTWKKIPKFKIELNKHRSIHKAEKDRAKQSIKILKEDYIKAGKAQALAEVLKIIDGMGYEDGIKYPKIILDVKQFKEQLKSLDQKA